VITICMKEMFFDRYVVMAAVGQRQEAAGEGSELVPGGHSQGGCRCACRAA